MRRDRAHHLFWPDTADKVRADGLAIVDVFRGDPGLGAISLHATGVAKAAGAPRAGSMAVLGALRPARRRPG